MSVHLYLSTAPEALVGSMLSPDEFGRYLALGAGKRTRTQALFFEIDREQAAENFHLAALNERCVPHEDGSPHRSTYVAIYRVLERMPISALKKLYLTTRDGTTLGLDPASVDQVKPTEGFYLYQEYCPVAPRVVSRLAPQEFGKSLTNPENAVFVPKIMFADYRLDALATDPKAEADVPYNYLEHIRYGLGELEKHPEKTSKVVDRSFQYDSHFWMFENGIFVASNEEMVFYPLPSEEELRTRHSDWWSSARAVERM